MIEQVRRVVMGEPEPGKSEFSHVEEVEPLKTGSGIGFWPVWGWDETPRLPHHVAKPYDPRSFFPAPGGLRVWVMGPGGTRAELEDQEDGRDGTEFARLHDAEPVGRYDDPSRPGMHRTDTIDIGVVISGEITSVADDGTKVVLHPGDIYIQNGALHAWEVSRESPAEVVWILIGAKRDPA